MSEVFLLTDSLLSLSGPNWASMTSKVYCWIRDQIKVYCSAYYFRSLLSVPILSMSLSFLVPSFESYSSFDLGQHTPLDLIGELIAFS